MANKVYVGVGHGGSDKGAVYGHYREADLNLEIANACTAELKKLGTKVKQSRIADTDMGINAKVSEANDFGADVCVDIHCNAGGGDGAEVYYSINGGKGKILAQKILDEIVNIGQNSRGIKTKVGSSGRDYFGMIRDTDMPSVLIECAFIDTKDVQVIDTLAEREAMGRAIARGVLRSMDIPYKYSKAVKKGVTGESVKYVKYALYTLGYLTKKPTNGIVGTKTVKAIKAFQKANGLEVDGSFGSKSNAMLKKIW